MRFFYSGRAFVFSFVLLLSPWAGFSQGLPQLDDFNTAPVDAGWIRYNPPMALQFTNQATFTIVDGAYRIWVPFGTRFPLKVLPNPGSLPVAHIDSGVGDVDDIVNGIIDDPRTAGDLGDGLKNVYLARSGAIRPVIYADHFQAVDVVKWDNASPGNFFGVMSQVGSPVFLTTTAYVGIYLKDKQVMILARMMSEIPVVLSMTHVYLDPARKYRFVMTGAGNNHTFSIFDAANLAEPLATAKTMDTLGALSGVSLEDALLLQAALEAVYDQTGPLPLPSRRDGSPVPYPNAGPAGVIVFNMDFGPADATFDNYLSAGNPNLNMTGFPGTPQVSYPVPGPNTFFHPASQGLSFTARTFWTNTIPNSGIKVLLNNVDVTANLTITQNTALPDPAPSELLALAGGLLGYPANTLGVSLNALSPQTAALDDGSLVRYNGPLASNTIYNVQVELTASNGARAVSSWSFDTFVESSAITIEAEDYNFNNGSYINAPQPSGQGGFPNEYLGNASATNNAAGGYFGKRGTPDIDYRDSGNNLGRNRTWLGDGLNGLFEYYYDWDVFTEAMSSHAYRSADGVGTTQEASDALRSRNAAANVSEYGVWLMSAGEWMNYTRNFPSTGRPYYNIYLRASAFRGGTLRLERLSTPANIAEQQTLALGRFRMTDTGSQSRYRYVPLTDSSGGLAVVELSGEKTLRLFAEDVNPATELNYLLIVPATNAPAVPTSYKVSGPASDSFTVQIHKARNSAPNEDFVNTPERAEKQLANQIVDPGTTQPYVNEAAGATAGIYTGIPVINFDQEGNPAGTISGDTRFPGVSGADPNHIAMSAVIYLQMEPGLYHWGVNSDDGFRVTSGPANNLAETVLGKFDGDRGATSTEFYFTIDSSGVYPFRLLYYENVGGASVEWYTVNKVSGTPSLLNAPLLTLPAEFSKPPGSGKDPGFNIHITKAPNNARPEDFPNTADRAERHLANQILDPNNKDENGNKLPYQNEAGDGLFAESAVINYQQSGVPAGFFGADTAFPGVDPYFYQDNDPNYISMEVTTYLDLKKGKYRMGVQSDDGFVVSSGPTALASQGFVLGRYDGGRPTRPTEFEFNVTKAGVYPFRLLYYEGQGGADVEWYIVDDAGGKMALINDPQSGVLAYQHREGDAVIPEIRLLNPGLQTGDFHFTFDTTSGVEYFIEKKTALGDAWDPVESVIGNGLPHTASYSREGASTFYRVKVSNP